MNIVVVCYGVCLYQKVWKGSCRVKISMLLMGRMTKIWTIIDSAKDKMFYERGTKSMCGFTSWGTVDKLPHAEAPAHIVQAEHCSAW